MSKTIGITGASSAIAKHLRECLINEGHKVYLFGRNQESYFNLNPFGISETVDLDLIIHLAWDFNATNYSETNFIGSKSLFEWCEKKQIEFIFISSLSAFNSATSIHGKTKFSLESEALSRKGAVIRPGLIYSLQSPFGITGAIQKFVKHLPILPIVGYSALQYPVELTHVVKKLAFVVHNIANFRGLITSIRPDQPIKFGVFLRALYPNKLPLPIPWRIPFWGLKLLHLFGLKTPFRADSLVGLINFDKDPPKDIAQEHP